MEAQVKIYTLAHPVTGEVKYIGKTKRTLKERVSGHLSIDKKEKSARVKWIKELKAQGLRPKAEVLEYCPKSDWERTEDFWINQFKAWGFDSVNTCDGGQGRRGYKMTDAERAQVAKQKPKAVTQYNLKGEVIGEFVSIAEASRRTGIRSTNICQSCLGQGQTAKGTIFKHSGDELTAEELQTRISKSKGIKRWQ